MFGALQIWFEEYNWWLFSLSEMLKSESSVMLLRGVEWKLSRPGALGIEMIEDAES